MSTLKEQICSPESAQELTELGVNKVAPVYTAEALGVILHKTPYTVIRQEGGCNFFRLEGESGHLYRMVATPFLGEYQHNEAEARARLIIMLLRNKVISL